MRDAVASGDLDRARHEAKTLADLRIEGPIDPIWKEKLAAMNLAAARVASSHDRNDASRSVGLVAKTCGDCHAILGRSGPVVGFPGGQASGVRPFMQRHQWAASRLWDGLVIPSDDAWKAGAIALSEAPLQPALLTPGKTPVPTIGELAQTVHDLGRKAQSLGTADTRADLYGQMLATCAACHQWLGGGPSAGRLP